MTPTIKLGHTEVPLLDYATGATAILGIRDSGKTVTAKGIAEQLLDNNIPIIVFDAVGKWRWLKVAGPKNGKGYEIVVAGGREPDLPLTPHSVTEIVRSSIKERIPLVIDLYDHKLSKADWRTIVQASIRVIHYENDGGPVHVFLEEAPEFIPQKVQDGNTYAEVEKLARMGGNASVGLTIIGQRSQEVNKAVLDLCTTLILGCQIGNKAIEAVEKWVDRLDKITAEAVINGLPAMKSGEAWVWTRQNPSAPRLEKMPMCRSLHPDRRTQDIKWKSTDSVSAKTFVARLSASIPKVIETAKANDPVELRKEITKLKAELARKPKPEATKVETKIKEVPVITKSDIAEVDKMYRRLVQVELEMAGCKGMMARFLHDLERFKAPPPSQVAPRRVFAPPPRRSVTQTPKAAPESNGDASVTGTQQRILDALAWFESIGNNEPSTLQVGAVALIDSSGGHFSNVTGPLSTNGLIERGNGTLRLTEEGRKHASLPEEAPSLSDFHQVLRQRIRKVRSANGKTVEILNFIIECGGGATTTADIGEALGIDHTGGHFSNSIGPLGTLGLIRRNQGVVSPTEILFPPGLT